MEHLELRLLLVCEEIQGECGAYMATIRSVELKGRLTKRPTKWSW